MLSNAVLITVALLLMVLGIWGWIGPRPGCLIAGRVPSTAVGALCEPLIQTHPRARGGHPLRHTTRGREWKTLAYVYGHTDPRDAQVAKSLTLDEARRIASNFVKLPNLLGKGSSLREPR